MPVSEEMKLVRRCFTTICIMKEIIKVNLFKEICIQVIVEVVQIFLPAIELHNR
jgi:hypothetical protein